MVALLLVSHSKALAEAARELVLQMTSRDYPIGIAAGVGDDHEELGTDAVHIAEVLHGLRRPEGILVLMDMGSAVLSAQAALELLEPEEQKLVRLSAAPFIEGAVIAAVQASAGSSLEEVAEEVERALVPKREQVEPIAPVESGAEKEVRLDGDDAEIVVTVHNEHGLHARPAASLVELAGKFACEIEVSNLRSGAGPASARSLTSIALLQVRKGDRIRIRVRGAEREAALRALQELADSGFSEGVAPDIRKQPERKTAVAASPGIAIGPLLLVETTANIESAAPLGTPDAEVRRLRDTLERVKPRLSQAATASSPIAAIQNAQAALLSDPVLLEKSEALLASGRLGASGTWARVCDEIAASYEAMDDGYLRERAADIRDVKQMVLRELAGGDSVQPFSPATPSIVLTEELLPSEAALCDGSHVLGVIARRGSATSHSAILLRAAGIPMVIGGSWNAADTGKLAAIDGSTGEVWIDPSETVLKRLSALQQQRRDRQQSAMRSKAEPAVSLDGVPIEMLANVSSVEDAHRATANCAGGIGLLRTELLLSSLKSLAESEQIRLIRDALRGVDGPVLVRTLDIGGDKPMPSVSCAPEGNPFLGVRGIRLTLRNLPFFRTHLRAILQAGIESDLWIMFPMVSSLAEINEARGLLAVVHEQLLEEAQPHAWPVKLGCMIEVPAAALMAESLARELDFFSIGTNDLTQYTMAAERGNAALAELQDALHPAVLQLIYRVVRGAQSFGRHVSICGEAASDPAAAAIFLGMGVRSLSIAPRLIPEAKAWVRTLRIAELRKLSELALQCGDAAEVRGLVSKLLVAAKQSDPAMR